MPRRARAVGGLDLYYIGPPIPVMTRADFARLSEVGYWPDGVETPALEGRNVSVLSTEEP